MKIINNQKGDSIIEVVLAMTLLTLIIFTAWSMVNQLKEQAEIIKSIYADSQSNIDEFRNKVINPTNEQKTLRYDEEFCNEDTTTGALKKPPTQDSFYMAYDSSGLIHNDGSKKVKNDEGSLVWVQWNKEPGKYIDFYIRGCWFTVGGVQKTDNAQFIMRLNYAK